MKTKTISVKSPYADKIKEYPNFSSSGSIIGMKKLYYGENACLVRCGSYIYNVPKEIYDLI